MPAISLRCRNCGHEVGLDGVGACQKCWGPLEPVYDLDEIRPRLTREKIADRPAVPVALRSAPAGGDPGRPQAPTGPDPARPGAPAGRGDRRARALAQAGHGQSHAFVQGPRRRRRVREGPGARAPDTGLLLDREPRGRGRGAGRRRRARCRGVLPGRPRAREAALHGGVRSDDLRGPRELRRLQPPDRRALLRAALGVREREPALLLRRGLQDGCLRDRRAARVAASPTPSSARSPRERCSRRSAGASASSSSSASSKERRLGSSAPRRRAATRSPPPTARSAR